MFSAFILLGASCIFSSMGVSFGFSSPNRIYMVKIYQETAEKIFYLSTLVAHVTLKCRKNTLIWPIHRPYSKNVLKNGSFSCSITDGLHMWHTPEKNLRK